MDYLPPATRHLAPCAAKSCLPTGRDRVADPRHPTAWKKDLNLHR